MDWAAASGRIQPFGSMRRREPGRVPEKTSACSSRRGSWLARLPEIGSEVHRNELDSVALANVVIILETEDVIIEAFEQCLFACRSTGLSAAMR